MVLLLKLMTVTLFSISVGEVGYNYLKIPQGPWGSLYQAAFVAMEGDPFEIFHNPASPKPYNTLGADVTSYVGGITQGSVAYCLSPDLGFGAQFLNSGSMVKTDTLGNELGTFSTNHLALLLSKRRVIGPRLDGGVNLKFLYQGIDKENSMAFAMDFGVLYRPPLIGVSVGATLRNLGYEIKPFISKRYLLPIELDLGATYRVLPGVRFGAGLAFSLDYPFAFSFAGEYRVFPMLTLGVGYTTKGKELSTGGGGDIINGFSFAASFRLFKVGLQYVFTPFGKLGDIHRIGTTLSF